ncbi:MAG TPA: glycosyltransferase family A protein [Terriglobales bacterium]|nr:glycosyltransferase family A protein [Terriglobales bacterium]
MSILIPAFNAQECVGAALESAVRQTWPRKEIIVVDDGSTDQTATIASRFRKSGVCVVRQEHQGAAAARNKALSLSQGDYIQWLDADDILAADKIATQMAAARQRRSPRTLFSSAWGRFLHRYYRAKFTPTGLWRDLSPVEWLLLRMNQNLYMQTATWLVSRELTEAAGPWDTRLLADDDCEYFCRVLLESDGTLFVPEARVYYRASGPRSLGYIGRSDKKLNAQWLSINLHIRYLRSLEDSERARAASVNFLQSWLIYFYPERLDIVRQAAQLASDLGGRLEAPRFPWAYSLITTALGDSGAKHTRLLLANVRWSLHNILDKGLFRIENLGPARICQNKASS